MTNTWNCDNIISVKDMRKQVAWRLWHFNKEIPKRILVRTLMTCSPNQAKQKKFKKSLTIITKCDILNKEVEVKPKKNFQKKT